MFRSTLRTILAAMALTVCAITFVSAQEVQVPQTAAEHDARAKAYRDQAAQYRQSAEEHKRMAETYAKAHPDMKGGVKNPWNQKMQKHCAMLAKDFEKLATDADAAAVFHEQRAKEQAATKP